MIFSSEDIERLRPDDLAYLARLKVAHGGRQRPFALDARALRRADFIPGWGRNKYMAMTRRLVESGDLVRIHRGGRRIHDPSFYRLAVTVPKQDPI